MTPSEALAAIKAAVVAAAGATAHESIVNWVGESDGYFGSTPIGLSVTLTLRGAEDESGVRYTEFTANVGNPPVATTFAIIERSMLHAIACQIDAIVPGVEYDFALALDIALNTETSREAHSLAEIELVNDSESNWTFAPVPNDGRALSRCTFPMRWRATVGFAVTVGGTVGTVLTEGTLEPGTIVVTDTISEGD